MPIYVVFTHHKPSCDKIKLRIIESTAVNIHVCKSLWHVDTFMSNISVHTLDVFVAAPGDAFIPPSARLRCSWRLTSYGEFPLMETEEGGRRECEDSHDSEWVRVIFSCPFITFIKVWGEDTYTLFDLFCQSLQWWDSQLRSLLQSDSSVSSKYAEEVQRDHEYTTGLYLMSQMNHRQNATALTK